MAKMSANKCIMKLIKIYSSYYYKNIFKMKLKKHFFLGSAKIICLVFSYEYSHYIVTAELKKPFILICHKSMIYNIIEFYYKT